MPAAESHSTASSGTAIPAPTINWLRVHWKLVLKLGGVATAATAIAAFIGSIEKIDASWRSHFSREPSVESEAALVQKIGDIRTQPESLRGTILEEVKVTLGHDPRLVAIGSRALLRLVRDEARWHDDAASCARASTLPASLQTALNIATKHPATTSWWRFWTLSQRPLVAELRLDSTNLHGVDLSSADLRGFNLQRSCLHSACFANAQMSHANLSNATVDSADFTDVHLDSARLVEAHGRDPIFTRSWLQGASLDHAILPHASFREAHMACATLEVATLDSANFWAAQIAWASFHKASLLGVTDTNKTGHVDSTRAAGAYIRTAQRLDPAVRGWLATWRAETSRAVTDWGTTRNQQWGADGACTRSLAEDRNAVRKQ
ncbi:MAG: pentapeptide repeat-containing protein [Gemmatimonadaceae bacterium]